MVLVTTCDTSQEKYLWAAIVDWLNTRENTKIAAASVGSTLSCLDSRFGKAFYFFSETGRNGVHIYEEKK